MAGGGAFLKVLQTFIYALLFCCSAVILALYSYFLATQASRDQPIPTWEKAVEGLSGCGVLYTIFAVVLTCCLGGISFFAFTAIVLDVLFCGAFIALAVLTRSGAYSCSDPFLNTPLGSGVNDGGDYVNGNGVQYGVSLRTVCRMQTACFAVSVIGAFLFLFAAFIQLWIGRHHQKEKRYGPSPANNYTSGSGNKWFARRRRGHAATDGAYAKDAEAGVAAGGLAVPAAHDNRVSHDTAYTGTTAGGAHDTYTGNKYEATQHVPTAGGYHTGPTGTGVVPTTGTNPYGYDNTRPTGTAVNY